MTPGLRLQLVSSFPPADVKPLIEDYMSRCKEPVVTDDGSGTNYSMTSSFPQSEDESEDVLQRTQFLVEGMDGDGDSGSTGGTSLTIEVTLINAETALLGPQDDASPIPVALLKPQSIVADIVAMGGWHTQGCEMGAEPNTVEFDDVEDWHADMVQAAQAVPQVIFGWEASSDRPTRSPRALAKVLAGIANVHIPASRSTWEAINEEMGRVGVKKGAIRAIWAEGDRLRHPLFDEHRIAKIEKRGFDEAGIRYEHYLFLKLARRAYLKFSALSDAPSLEVEDPPDPAQEIRDKLFDAMRNKDLQIEEARESYEVLDDAYNTLTIEYQKLKEEARSLAEDLRSAQRETALLEEANSDLRSETESLENSLDEKEGLVSRYKDHVSKLVAQIKEKEEAYKSLDSNLQELRPVLEEIIDKHQLDNFSSLLETLRRELIEEPEEAVAETSYDTVHQVLEAVRDNWPDKFTVSPSAFESASKSPFRFPNRVLEAFEMMERVFDYIKNRAMSGQTLDFEKSFRTHVGDFEVANREKGATMKKFGKQRSFMVNGKRIQMQPHIKIGKGSTDKCLRIHFTFDKESGRFLIGHCGKHLPTAGRN